MNTSKDMPRERLLTEKQARSILPLSLAWFRAQRLRGKPPKYLKISNRVFYRERDLLDFIDSRPTGGGSTESPNER